MTEDSYEHKEIQEGSTARAGRVQQASPAEALTSLSTRLSEQEAEIARLRRELDEARAGNRYAQLEAIAIRRAEKAEVEVGKLKAALERIGSCESHHPDDVVSIARQALGGGHE